MFFFILFFFKLDFNIDFFEFAFLFYVEFFLAIESEFELNGSIFGYNVFGCLHSFYKSNPEFVFKFYRRRHVSFYNFFECLSEIFLRGFLTIVTNYWNLHLIYGNYFGTGYFGEFAINCRNFTEYFLSSYVTDLNHTTVNRFIRSVNWDLTCFDKVTLDGFLNFGWYSRVTMFFRCAKCLLTKRAVTTTTV